MISDTDIDWETKNWLNTKTLQNDIAKFLLEGKGVSAVTIDPVGGQFPRHWYPFNLGWSLERGMYRHSINKKYLGLPQCDICGHKTRDLLNRGDDWACQSCVYEVAA